MAGSLAFVFAAFSSATAQVAAPVAAPNAENVRLDAPRGETVTSRLRPELEPLGIRIDSFHVYPALAVRPEYNSNVFATLRDERGDMITEVAPRLNVRSDWKNHALNLYAGAALGQYLVNTNEDYEDYGTGALGRFDVTRESAIFGRLDTQKLHDPRGSPDDTAGLHPTEYRHHTGNLEFRQKMGRFNIGLSADTSRYDFSNGSALSNGGLRVINNHDRDRWSYGSSLRVGYEIVPNYEAFIRGGYDIRRYDVKFDDSGFHRDSEGWKTEAGVRLDLTGLTFGDIYGGYLSRNYDDPRLETASGLLLGADLTWVATPLITATAFFERSIEETTLAGGSGNFATRVGAAVDYELLRNLLLRAEANGRRDDFQGAGRIDDTTSFAAGAKYLMNRYLYVTVRFADRFRDSNVPNANFDEKTVLLRLETQY